MEPAIRDVLEAHARGDREALRLLLHPYLHWTDGAGVTLRGRTNVMVRLDETPSIDPPRSYELRDGQIYRWHSGD